MKNIRIILMTMLIFLALSTPVFADSYTIDKVHIRAWIQPNGDLLLNEVFKYTFKGDYHRVRRSIQTDHHKGVTNFYAYELLNPDAEPGFVKEQNLRSLKVTKEDNSYYAALPAEDEEKTVFFVYRLKHAVKSYETYSDLVVPFFGTGSNHDQDLHDVTIDFVFPQEIEPGHYDAFLHDREIGNIQKDRVVVRFTTPISPMYSLTETRLLFPSSVMTEQKKIAAPVSLEKAIEQEKTLAKQMAGNKQKREQLQHALPYLTIVMGAGCLILMTLSLLRRLKSSGSMKELLHTDPLVLYFIHRLGKKDRYGYFAALYSLVEKGAAKVKLDKTAKRFQHDPDAPDYQLLFTLKDTSVPLTPHENKLISWLFKKLGKKSKNSFSMMNAAGTTKKEKDEQRQLLGYQGKQMLFKQGEKEWLDAALHHMKAGGLMSDKLIRLLVPLLLAIVFSVVLYSYMLDSLSKGAMLTYSIIAAILFWLAWRNPAKRWRTLLFFFVSFIAALMLYDAALVKQMAILIPAAALLYLLTPRMTLSSEAAILYEDIRQFRKQVKKQGLPPYLSETELEKWAVRSLILKTRQARSSFEEIAAAKADLFSAAPLAFLLSEAHDPVSYLEDTWKWSKAVSADSSSGGGSYDSGGFFSSDSGGGGGDGGGGGGAD